MGKRYKLIKDLPTFKAGCVFEHDRGLWWVEDELGRKIVRSLPVCAYAECTLKNFPNILKDWFEEIPEKPKTVDDLEGAMRCWVIGDDAV